MAIIQVLDQNDLPVHCQVAAVNPATGAVRAIYQTDANGQVQILEPDAWYPRALVSRNYKIQTKMIPLGGDHAPCFTYVVDPDGNGTHLTIQSAMDDGDALNASFSVFICPGTYVEQVTVPSAVGASVTIVGSGLGAVTIKPTGSGNAVTFAAQSSHANTIVLENVKIDTDDMSAGAVGLNTGSANHVKLSNIEFFTGSATDIGLVVRQLTTGGSSVSECTFSGTGIGIDTAADVSHFSISSCDFQDGLTTGIRLDTGDEHITIDDNTIMASTGIALNSLLGEAVVISNNRFSNCSTDGIKFTTSGQWNTVAISANSFYNCSDGIDANDDVETCAIVGNVFSGIGDVGIRGNATTFQRNTIVGNTFEGYTANNEMVNVSATLNEVAHNVTDSGATLPDSHASMLASTFAPVGAQYVTLALDANLTNERVLTTANGVTVVDGGAGSTLTLRVSLLRDADNDTTIDVETTADEDKIRIKTAGTQRGLFDSNGLAIGPYDNTSFTIAGSSTASKLTVQSVGGALGQELLATVQRSSNGGVPPNFNFLRARGTVASPTVVTSGSFLGGLQFYGYDGADYEFAAAIYVSVDGTPGSGDMPGRIEFHTSPDGGAAPVERLSIKHDGVVVFTAARERWPITAKTISSDQIAIAVGDTGHWTLAGEGGAADDLDGITGGTQGEILILSPVSDSVTITVKHNNAGGSSGAKIFLNGDADVVLDDIDDTLTLIYKLSLDSGAGGWMEVCRGGGGGGVSAHTLLDGGTAHSDTATDSVSRGSIIYGNSTPAWDELTLAADRKVFTSDGTDLVQEYVVTVGTYASRPAASTAMVGRLYMATDRANTLYRCKDATTWEVVNPRHCTLRWTIDGLLRADASNAQGGIRYLPDLDGITTETVTLWKPVRVKAHLYTASAGASVLLMLEYGTTATPGTDLLSSQLTLSAGSTEATSTSFADTTIENGTAIELLIDQVGSTAGSEGKDLDVEIEFVQQDA